MTRWVTWFEFGRDALASRLHSGIRKLLAEGREGRTGREAKRKRSSPQLRERRRNRRDVISIDDDDGGGDGDDCEIEERKGWCKRRFYSNVYRSWRVDVYLCKYASTISCVKRTLSLPPPSYSLSSSCSLPLSTHIFRNIYVRREEEELDGEEREKDGDRESTGYILLPHRLRGGWRGPLGWLPHERCIRRLTGGAIKSRQQTNRQSPLCTP